MNLSEVEEGATKGTVIYKVKNSEFYFSRLEQLQPEVNNGLISADEIKNIKDDFFKPMKIKNKQIVFDPLVERALIESVKIVA